MANFVSLNVPPAAIEKGGNELLRVAIAQGELYMSLKRGFDDPEAWGRALSEIVRHVSQVYAAETPYNKETAVKRILDAFAEGMAGDASGAGSTVAKR
jgi:hypothetical protein